MKFGGRGEAQEVPKHIELPVWAYADALWGSYGGMHEWGSKLSRKPLEGTRGLWRTQELISQVLHNFAYMISLNLPTTFCELRVVIIILKRKKAEAQKNLTCLRVHH